MPLKISLTESQLRGLLRRGYMDFRLEVPHRDSVNLKSKASDKPPSPQLEDLRYFRGQHSNPVKFDNKLFDSLDALDIWLASNPPERGVFRVIERVESCGEAVVYVATKDHQNRIVDRVIVHLNA